ncbi:MAG: DUF58 domain-containing protein [Deltaproteobacteria bacterium]|nr:DUF58 domain-containing protein [Deltaproteobacteria bacterium]
MATGFPIALIPVLVSPQLWTLWLTFVGAVLVLMAIDTVLALPRRRLKIDIEPPETLYIGDSDDLVIGLEPRGWRRRLRLEVLCDLGPDLEVQPTRRVVIPGGQRGEVRIELSPRRRGTARVEKLWLRWTGPFGLTSRVVQHLVGKAVPVVPNVKAVRSAAIRFFAEDAMLGLKLDRNKGDGSEFESLRDYVVGMDHRAMDWKHSARHRKLVCKEFRAERNHQIVLAVDTGYLMSEPLAGIPKLDHAINAALLLGYFSLRAGDRISLYAFDSKVRAFSEPQSGVGAFPRLQRMTADLEYQHDETNFTLALAELATRLRRRSLVVVLTDFVDSITAELMVENVQRLARRHLVLFVATRDPSMEAAATGKPYSVRDIGRAVVAGQFDRERDVVIERLKRSGVHCVDVDPSQVSVEMLNRYLEIKRRELI